MSTVSHENHCPLVYNTVHLMPYYVLIFNVMLYMAFNQTLILIGRKLLSCCKCERFAEPLEGIEMSDVTISIPEPSKYEPEELPTSCINIDVDGIVEVFHFFYAFVVVIYLIYLAASAKGDFTSWDRYQMLYGSMTNSFPGNYITAHMTTVSMTSRAKDVKDGSNPKETRNKPFYL